MSDIKTRPEAININWVRIVISKIVYYSLHSYQQAHIQKFQLLFAIDWDPEWLQISLQENEALEIIAFLDTYFNTLRDFQNEKL